MYRCYTGAGGEGGEGGDREGVREDIDKFDDIGIEGEIAKENFGILFIYFP